MGLTDYNTGEYLDENGNWHDIDSITDNYLNKADEDYEDLKDLMGGLFI